MLSLALLGTKPNGARKRFTKLYFAFLFNSQVANSLVYVFIYVKYTR